MKKIANKPLSGHNVYHVRIRQFNYYVSAPDINHCLVYVRNNLHNIAHITIDDVHGELFSSQSDMENITVVVTDPSRMLL